jgi:hypothetical protein
MRWKTGPWRISTAGKKRWQSCLSSSYDLGESMRLVLCPLLKVKVNRSISIFNTADVVITKMDLAEAVGSIWRLLAHPAVRPGIRTIELSVKTGVGMDQYFELVNTKVRRNSRAKVVLRTRGPNSLHVESFRGWVPSLFTVNRRSLTGRVLNRLAEY